MAVNKLQNMTISEVLKLVSNTKSKADKIAALQENNSLALRDVLKGSFDDSIEWLLPEGTPPYTPCRPESIPSNLIKLSKRLAYFVKGVTQINKPLKRESMFVGMLESIDPDDAVTVIHMKEKNLGALYKGINKALVQEAFPGLIAK